MTKLNVDILNNIRADGASKNFVKSLTEWIDRLPIFERFQLESKKAGNNLVVRLCIH